MANFNQIFKILRAAAFTLTSLFAVAVIVLGALITNFSDTYLGGYYTFAALGIAIGALTLLTLPLMLLLSILRKGVVTSLVVVDVVWTWLLWIFWLAVAGSSSSIYLFGNCGRYSSYSSYRTVVTAACVESTALTAFAFLSWIILLVYSITIISLAFRQHIRGNTSVWTKDITQVDFTAQRVNTTQVVQVNPAFAPQYPPTHPGTPVFVPQQPTPGSYIQPQVGYPQQAPNQQPYAQPQVNSPYAQPQATGSFTHPPTGTSAYPQV